MTYSKKLGQLGLINLTKRKLRYWLIADHNCFKNLYKKLSQNFPNMADNIQGAV